MSGIAYTRFELLRTFRNRRFLLFALGFPLVFFWLIAAPQHNKIITGTGSPSRRTTWSPWRRSGRWCR